jgi:hypothetical protein
MAYSDEGPGFKFWAGLVGIVLACGIGGMILLLIFSRAVYAWGFLGAFVVLCIVLLAVAWIYDRRQVKSYVDE